MMLLEKRLAQALAQVEDALVDAVQVERAEQVRANRPAPGRPEAADQFVGEEGLPLSFLPARRRRCWKSFTS
jgi:hypothetical protein